MRYGFHLPHHRNLATPELIAAAAKRGDDQGWDSVWLSDHVLLPNEPSEQHRRVFYEPLSMMAYLAAATSRVRIGTSVIVVPYRDPIVAAKQIATADALSGGRLVVGVGAGGLTGEFALLGVPFNRRGRLTDEYLRIWHELWANDDPRFAGETVTFGDALFFPKPAQRPGPPILVGGSSPAALRRAATLGDGWHPTFLPIPDLIAGIGRFREECAKAGRPDTLPIVYRSICRLLDAPDARRRPFIGTPDQIREDLAAHAAAGVDEMVLDFAIPPVETPAEWLATLDVVADAILPKRPA